MSTEGGYIDPGEIVVPTEDLESQYDEDLARDPNQAATMPVKKKKMKLWSKKKKNKNQTLDPQLAKSFSSEVESSSVTNDSVSEASDFERTKDSDSKKHFWSKKSKSVKTEQENESQSPDTFAPIHSGDKQTLKSQKSRGQAYEPPQISVDLEEDYPESSSEASPKDSKKKFWKKLHTKKKLSVEIGAPYNVVHQSHVDFEYKWTLQDPHRTFELQDLLGSGTFGSVYKAKHRESGFILAIKVIKTNDAAE
eukprot:TRINITY_DN8308_c0_g1_i3.p1 TRINITY_DN8308_c0_g1~~TRINITY_DN8308_c0_g1_i3.p1  ORF type:complete len:251 (+),score=56.02 TRINITY_DN8308_c0_g1_i3:50-802(+)